MKQGSTHSEETKRKIREASLGKKKIFSEKAIQNIREAAAKRKGIKRGPRPEEVKRKISEATTGVKKTITKPNSSWFIKGHIPIHKFSKGFVPWNKGKKLTPEQIEKIASKLRGRKISEEHCKRLQEGLKKWWSTIPPKKTRNSKKLIEWNKAILERDGYKCKNCGATENLHVHHIIPWNKNEELRFELSNGITYCKSCHASIENKGKSSWIKGKKHSPESIEKMKKAKIGHIPHNKGKRKIMEKTKKCRICGIEKSQDRFTPSGNGWTTNKCKDCRNLELKIKRINLLGG